MSDGDKERESEPQPLTAVAEETEFRSWQSFWKFRAEASRERRFIRSEEAEAFLKAVRSTATRRVRDIPVGWIGWRAAIDHGWRYETQIDDEIPCAAKAERMRPWPDKAHEGRVNPKGIPCLYLATERDTAMSEVRPWIGSLVSVARFQTVRPLRVVDCLIEWNSTILIFDEPEPRGRVRPVWSNIDNAFSEPMTRSDDTADYAITQILAELFKDEGYDGVVYKSSFGEKGYNVALFDINSAVMLSCGLFRVKGATYDFSDQGEEYFVKDPN